MHLNAKINYYFMFKINHGTGSLIQIDMLTVLIYKERKTLPSYRVRRVVNGCGGRI